MQVRSVYNCVYTIVLGTAKVISQGKAGDSEAGLRGLDSFGSIHQASSKLPTKNTFVFHCLHPSAVPAVT